MKRFSQLTQTATEADLVAGNFLAIDVPGADGATKKLPAENVAKRSEQNALVVSVNANSQKIAKNSESIEAGVTKNTEADYTAYNGIPSPGSATWYVGGGAKHIAIPLKKDQLVSVTPSALTTYIFCNSSYVPENKTNGSVLEVSSRNVARYEISSKMTFAPVGDDAYLILTSVTGGGVAISWDIEIYNELEIVKLFDKAGTNSNIGSEIIEQSKFMSYRASVASYADIFYWQGNNGRHIDIPVQHNSVYVLTPSVVSICAIGGSSYVEGDKADGTSISLADGRGRVITSANSPISFVTRDTDKYLIVNVVDGGGNAITWDIKRFFAYKKNITSVKKTEADFTAYNGIPSNNEKTWYYWNVEKPKHIALPLNKGCVVSVKPSIETFFVFCTSDYTYGNKTSGETLYSSDRTPVRERIPANQTMTFTAGSSDAYLILVVVDGAGTNVSWDIEYNVWGDCEDELELDSRFKIRFGTWNIGHFSMGTQSSTTITPAEKDEKIEAFRTLLNSLNLDILGICEDDPVFCTDNTRSIPAIYSLFEKKSQPVKRTYNCNSLYYNFSKTLNDELFFFPVTYQVRFLHEIGVIVNGKKIVFAETHLELDAAARATEISSIISRYSNYDYVVIGGDWNISDISELDPFKSAGYKLALGDYMPQIATYPASNSCIDNIVVKGFAISNVSVNEGSSELSDHCVLSCDLTMV